MGLKRKFIGGNLLIALLSMVMMLASSIMFYRLYQRTDHMTHQTLPLTESLHKMEMGIIKSLANSKENALGTTHSALKDYDTLWGELIYPNFYEAETITRKNKDNFAYQKIQTLKSKLLDLHDWQWRIQDVSTAQNNKPAQYYTRTYVTPLSNRIIETITQLIDLEKEQRMHQTRRQLLLAMIDFRVKFIQSWNLMNHYIVTHDRSSRMLSYSELALAKEAMQRLEKQASLCSQQQEQLYRNLASWFVQYPQHADQVTRLEQEKINHLSHYWLSNKATPIAESIRETLDELSQKQEKTLLNNTEVINTLSTSVLYAMIAVILFIPVFSYWLAARNAKRWISPIHTLLSATQKMADGRLDEDIAVTTQDELGELTQSFNQMRLQRENTEQKAKAVSDTSPDPIILIDHKGIMQSCNPATEKLLGYQKEELINKNISRIMPEPYASQHDFYLKRYQQTKEKRVIGITRVLKAKKKMGEVFPIQLYVSEVVIQGKHYFLGVIRDITIEQEQEEKIKSINKRLAEDNKKTKYLQAKADGVINTAIDPIIIIDKHGIIESCNAATLKLLGYEEKELVGSNVANITPEHHQKHHDQYIKSYLKTKIKKRIGRANEEEAVKKNGERVPVLLTVSVIEVEGEVFFAGMIRDLTKEKEKEKEINEVNEKLEKENEQKTLLAELDKQLRGIESVKQFADITLSFFAENFSIPLSLFYIIEKDELSLISSFGLSPNETALKTNEGLLNQVIQTKEPIVMTDLPKDFIHIKTGLGHQLPEQLVLMPFVHEENAIGVIEFCIFSALKEETFNLFKHFIYNMVVALSMVISRSQLQTLLDKTQKQSLALQQQEEELRLKNDELEEQTNALKSSEEELKSGNEELTQQIAFIEQTENRN